MNAFEPNRQLRSCVTRAWILLLHLCSLLSNTGVLCMPARASYLMVRLPRAAALRGLKLP